MNCQRTRELLPEYQEDALADAQRREMEAHLSTCVPCKAALAEANNLDPFLRGAVRVPERTPEDWTKQEGRILQAAARPGSRNMPPYFWLIGIAAACLLAVGIFALSSRSEPSVPPGTEVVSQPQTPGQQAKPRTAPRRWPPTGDERPERTESSPSREPDPRMFTFPRENSSTEVQPAPAPAPTFTPDVTAVSSLLPGDPEHLGRLTDENIEVGLADSPSERVMGLLKAADSRLSELRAAVGARKDSTAENLVTAYTMIFRQGIAAILADREESAQEIATARVVARTYAGWNVDGLAKLETAAQGSLKSAIHEALLATRELAGQ